MKAAFAIAVAVAATTAALAGADLIVRVLAHP